MRGRDTENENGRGCGWEQRGSAYLNLLKEQIKRESSSSKRRERGNAEPRYLPDI